MANAISAGRVMLSVVLLFVPTFSSSFYLLYILAGLTDMIDGAVARITHTASEFGAKLDTAADFVFVMVCLIKIIPYIDITAWLYVWIAIIALIKLFNIFSGYIIQKEFVAVHSIMNKTVGVVLFILPLTFSVIPLKYSGVAVCTIATFAAIQEGHFIRTGFQEV